MQHGRGIAGSTPARPALFFASDLPKKKKGKPRSTAYEAVAPLAQKSSPEASAVLAERLRRMLKAHVRKSVGSIPTDRSFLVLFFLFCFSGLMSRMENCVGPEIEPYPGPSRVRSSILAPRHGVRG